jgi:NAD(P)-dependent dehydrogenase (short-subunit alcohol dehydrogenase family)
MKKSKHARHVNLVGGTKGLGDVFHTLCKKEKWLSSLVARNACKNTKDVFLCDVTDKNDIAQCLNQISKKNGTLDAIVFFQRYRGDGDSWKGHFEVSVKAIDNYIQESLQYMDKNFKKDKSIVIVSSISSLYIASEQDAAYHATRTAQIGLTRYYAHKLGSMGIRVNAVSFGNILKKTNIDYFNKNQKLKASFEKCTPLKRMGTSEEIANVIKFLVSKESSWITGQNIIVDGGSSLGWIESFFREEYGNLFK